MRKYLIIFLRRFVEALVFALIVIACYILIVSATVFA